jgi:ankyrin repeat protein
MQGKLFLGGDGSKRKITPAEKLTCGENELYYAPIGTGEHILTLKVTDAYHDLEKEIVFKTIHVKDKRDIPFEAVMDTADKSIFVHKQAILSLSLSSNLKEASGLAYKVKAIEVTQGALFFEEGHEEVKVGSKLKWGKQNLLFKPRSDIHEETLAIIKLTLENDKGNEAKLVTTITVKPVRYKLQAWAKELSENDIKRIKVDCSIVEIMLTGVDEALHKEEWKLVSWKCSDRVRRTLLNDELAELEDFILKVPEKNRFYVKLPHLDVGNPPTLTLQVKGPDGSVQKATVQFSSAQRIAITGKIEALIGEIAHQTKKVDTYLNDPTTYISCEELSAFARETEKKLAGYKEALTSIGKSPTLQEDMLPEKMKSTLEKLLEEDIPSLEKKKIGLAIASKEKEKIPFEAVLEVQDKSIFIHEEAPLSLVLSSKMKEAQQALYSVKAMEVEHGGLFLEEGMEAVEVGSKLKFGSQKLIFKPSRGIDTKTPVTLKLTIANDKGSDAAAFITIEVKPINFKVEAWAKEPSEDERKKVKGDCSVIEIMLRGIEQGLLGQSWNLVSWDCSDGTPRALVNERLEELETFPLNSGQVNKLYLKLPNLEIGHPPSLTLAVEGPLKTIKKAVVKLTFAQRMAISSRLKNLSKEIAQTIINIDTYLHKSPGQDRSIDELKSVIKEHKKKIEDYQETIGMIQNSHTMQEGSLSHKINQILKRIIEEEIPTLEKKTSALGKKLQEKKQAHFNASLTAVDKSIFVHEKAALSLELHSEITEAHSVSYKIKEIAVSNGKLLFEKDHKEITVGSSLEFGKQNLVFEPSPKIEGQVIADVKLKVVNEKGSECTVMSSIELKPIKFDLQAWAKEATRKEMRLAKGDCMVVEIMLNDIAEGLEGYPWKLAGWDYSDGVSGVLLSDQWEELSAFPLKASERTKLYFKLQNLEITKPHTISLHVEGPGKKMQKRTIKLLAIQQSIFTSKLESLLEEIKEEDKKVADYLERPLKSRDYDELRSLGEDTEEKLAVFKDRLALLQDSYMVKDKLVSEKARATLAKIAHQDLPCLEEKESELSEEEKAWKEILEAIGKGAKGSYMNKPDEEGRCLLHRYFASGCKLTIKQVQFIIDRTTDINIKDSAGMTPFHLAIKALTDYSHPLQAVNLLLKHGAELSINFPDGEPILLYALKMKDIVVGKGSFGGGEQFNTKEKLLAEAEEKAYALLRTLLDHGANPNITYPKTGETPLTYAAKDCSTYEYKKEKMSALLLHKANPDLKSSDGKSPLQHLLTSASANTDKYKLMDLLLDQGANVNEVWENEVPQVSTEEEPKPRFFGTALLWAIGQYEGGDERLASIKGLLNHKADPSLPMESGGYSRYNADISNFTPYTQRQIVKILTLLSC